MVSFRLPQGGLIDRDKKFSWSFDGQKREGFQGDTVASALLASGQKLMGRSFKYHRPRGVVTAGSAEPNALMTVGAKGRTAANSRATMVELHDGLSARSQNRWPTLAFDINAVNGLFSPLISAGFYYKTFMYPAAFWEKVYEPLIRRAAGLGKASYEADPDHYEKQWLHCDLLVIGGGPAGLAAALVAGRAGARVILIDENPSLGGMLWGSEGEVDGRSGQAFAASLGQDLDALANVRVMTRTTAFGWYDQNVFGVLERSGPDTDGAVSERLWRIVAKKAILASGAEERPLVFGGNDRPGIMQAHAMVAYAGRYGVGAGREVTIFTNGSQGYAAAANLEAMGVDVAAIIDVQDTPVPYTGAAQVFRDAVVIGTNGGRALQSITIETPQGRQQLRTDALGMAGGWSPRIHLACHRGSKAQWSEQHQAFLGPQDLEGLSLVGSAAGIASTADCVVDGAKGATQALTGLGISAEPLSFNIAQDPFAGPEPKALWFVRGSKGKAFVDLQNDVHVSDLTLARQEGFGHAEHAKRYTTNGMATDQGKLSGINAAGILAELNEVSPAEVGTTTFRPFYTPVSFGALTGPYRGIDYRPHRLSPLHQWAVDQGASFVEAGQWHRPCWYARKGEKGWRDSVDREVLTVRNNVGICDVSTLGKIELFGKDAATFLNRLYINAFEKLAVGKARYGVMLREDGFVYDDGTTSRLGEHHFFVTTTTAQAAGVLAHMEYCAQVLWPDLKVEMASVSDQWAQMAIAGPKARAVLERIVDQDLSNEAVPFLAAREISLLDGAVHGRLFRISFSGELAYELAVPANFGPAIADRLMAAGEEFGIAPYGTEALSVLRIEKGHVTHAEIDGRMTPADLGLGRMVSKKKADFIGKALLNREALTD
ncbi:MAG: sarcosine oxidase subunit alpha family protein, partial [Pseudomonadota bacterium]